MPFKPLESKIVMGLAMLWRLVAKLMLKAMVPLIALAGVFSYGSYMRGGDPAMMWKKLAQGGSDRVSGIFSGMQNDASRAAGALSSKSGVAGGSGKLSSTQVFTWQDADGVTHYSTTAPSSGVAQTVTIDPNVNVVAPVQASVEVLQDNSSGNSNESFAHSGNGSGSRQNGRGQSGNQRGGSRQSGSAAGSDGIADVENELGGTLPGVAGQILSGQSGDSSGQGIDPSQLIRMLQSAGN